MSETVTYDKTGEDGRFEATYEPEEFLDAVDALELPTTSDVAETVECAHRTALHHLNNLEDDGRLDSRMIGRAKVWSAVDDVEASPRDRTDSVAENSRDAALAAVEANDDLPSDIDTEDAVAAVSAVVEFLKTADGQKATMREIVAATIEAHPLKYDVVKALTKIEAGERYRGGWWRIAVKPSLEAHPNVEKPPEGASNWKYVDA